MSASLHSRLVSREASLTVLGSNASASAGTSSGGAPFAAAEAAEDLNPLVVAPGPAGITSTAADHLATAAGIGGEMKSMAALDLHSNPDLEMGRRAGEESRGRPPPLKPKVQPPPQSPPSQHHHQQQQNNNNNNNNNNSNGSVRQKRLAVAPYPKGLTAGQRIALTLAMPLLVLYCTGAFAVAWLSTFTIVPSYILAQRLYWACPFIPHIWRRMGLLTGTVARVGFEASHCINVVTRLLTLPLRPHLPAFYILGFPKCGTTSLAEHLKTHPGLSATAGLPYHEALAKESHFFQGVYGRSHASSRLLYRSCFPTVVTRWWHEVVRGAPAWMCFDACPVNACLPYIAERIKRLTPDAKFVVMLRDPVPGAFSAEIMMLDMGVPLEWTLTEPVAPNDPGVTGIPPDVASLWRELAVLPPEAPLPYHMPYMLYNSLGATLQCGMYAELLQPFLEQFPRERFLFINFGDFVKDTERIVREVLDFVGAEADKYRHVTLPPAMKNNYGSRRMHPTAVAALTELFREPNRRVAALLGRHDLGWTGLGSQSV